MQGRSRPLNEGRDVVIRNATLTSPNVKLHIDFVQLYVPIHLHLLAFHFHTNMWLQARLIR